MNKFGRNIALWIVIGVLLVALFNLFQNNTSRSSYSSLAFSDFLGEVEQGRVSDVTIQGNTINGHFNDGRAFSTYAPNDPGIVDRLRGGGVRISAAPKEEGMSGLLGILISWFPMLLFIGVWIFFMRQMQGGGGRARILAGIRAGDRAAGQAQRGQRRRSRGRQPPCNYSSAARFDPFLRRIQNVRVVAVFQWKSEPLADGDEIQSR